ncbi:MAG: GWxTD domain-containing protein [Flavobacteriales bacterium]
MNSIRFFWIVCFACVFSTQASGQRVIRTDQQRTKADPVKPDVVVYHSSLDYSEVHFRISSRDIMYARTESGEFTAHLVVNYRLFTLESVKQVVDSGTLTINDTKSDVWEKFIGGSFKVKMPQGATYSLKIQFVDKKKNSSMELNITADKKEHFNRQNFLLRTSEVVNCTPYLQQQNVSVESPFHKGKQFWVRVYRRSFSLAPPPFSEQRLQQFKYEADSIYRVRMDEQGKFSLILPEGGFVHIVADTSSRVGLSLFHFPRHFPRVMTPDALIEPLRYICSSEEFKTLRTAIDQKKSIDQFWLDRSSSRERARELIRNYYNRVQESNRRYSSYLEGWKTDRGMIYLIFGEPAFVDRTTDSETWIYGDRFSTASLRFNFLKIQNPFSDNDFLLQRMPVYKPEWYKAVDVWRSGRVYYYLN